MVRLAISHPMAPPSAATARDDQDPGEQFGHHVLALTSRPGDLDDAAIRESERHHPVLLALDVDVVEPDVLGRHDVRFERGHLERVLGDRQPLSTVEDLTVGGDGLRDGIRVEGELDHRVDRAGSTSGVAVPGATSATSTATGPLRRRAAEAPRNLVGAFDQELIGRGAELTLSRAEGEEPHESARQCTHEGEGHSESGAQRHADGRIT